MLIQNVTSDYSFGLWGPPIGYPKCWLGVTFVNLLETYRYRAFEDADSESDLRF